MVQLVCCIPIHTLRHYISLIYQFAGNLLKGPVDANGKLKDAALMVGIKLDLEAEVHLTARIRGDILVGLYWFVLPIAICTFISHNM